MIVWLNGTHGAGKTTTSALLDAEKVGETLGLAGHAVPVRHFVLHADQCTLRRRIHEDTVLGPSAFRLSHPERYAEAARTWLHDAAEVVDTTHLTPAQVAARSAGTVTP